MPVSRATDGGGEAGDAHAEYTARLAERAEERARRARLCAVVSNLRLAVFAVGVVAAWAVFGAKSLAAGWLWAPFAAFVALVGVHDRLLRARDRAARAVDFYERGLARLEDRWAGGGEDGARFRDPQHPYAEDLDLFGRGSLFERLCSARTRAGEAALAGWLLSPASPEEARARQAAVTELRPRLDLRESLALLGEAARAELHPEALRAWGEAPTPLASPRRRIAAAALAGLSVATLAAWLAGGAGPAPFGAVLAAQGLFAWQLRRRVLHVVRSATVPARDLALLGALLERLERESFSTPLLARLRAALDVEGSPPSKRVAALRLRTDLLDARRNQLFAPIGALLLWSTQLALSIERWRQTCGPALGRWLDAAAEIEALVSLAAYAYERPQHPFPEIADGGALFEAEDVGHPLLPAGGCVGNDVRLGDPTRVLVVSGSNMSGKSTLLRTVGTNTVLALAGAPVCARRLRVAPLAIGASLRIQDSLQEGSSRFYAEIRRLRGIMELAQAERPVLFLLDEILHGTNSHDRGVGAAAVVRGLVEAGAIGLVTTHDLALAGVADALGSRGANVHFEDHLQDGRIAFDYRMRPGVVERGNALELMRSVGLPV